MPSTIDATKGGESANSYATVEEADARMDDIFSMNEEWGSVSSDDKTRLLLTATTMIDGLQLLENLDKADEAQKLNFPVDYEEDDGYEAAKEACIMQAHYLFRHREALIESEAHRIGGVKSENVSGYSKSVTGFNPMAVWSPDALMVLGDFVDTTVRLGRA